MSPRLSQGEEPDGGDRASDFHPCDPPSWEEEIRRNLRPDYVVVGVGNRLRGDDGAGPVIAERLSRRGLGNAFDCGETPENYLGRIEKLRPGSVLFIDAADIDREPGSIELFSADSFQVQSVSTHSAGLSALMDFLAASCEATCWVLAVQPADVGHGAALSAPVQAACEQIVSSDVWFEPRR